jgi:hypothetical protein
MIRNNKPLTLLETKATMKFLIPFALLPTILCAQITLEVSDFADGGDTVRVSNSNDFSLDYTSTGESYNWDFSSLVAESQSLKDFQSMDNASTIPSFTFGAFATEAYQATNFAETVDIPLDQAGDFLPISIDAINQFSKNATDGITSVGLSVGISGTEIPVLSDTIETRYALPMNYGDNYTSNGYSYLDLNPIFNAIWIQYRTRNTQVDGWGNITTPYGSFEALRIRHEVIESDSVYIDLFGGPQWFELPVPISYEYEWITKNEKEPILKITTREVGDAETISSVVYKDNFLNLNASIQETQNVLKLGPNPTEYKLVISGISGAFNYQVFDHKGQLIQSSIAQLDYSIDLSNSESGAYLVIINSSSGKSIHKIIKK